MNLLTLLKTDLAEICEACIEWRLWDIDIEFEPQATVCKYAAVKWYPESPPKWEEIKFDFDPFEKWEADLYFWSVEQAEDWKYIMWSSRALAIVAMWDNISDAKKKVDNKLSKIHWPIMYREDIWSEELVNKRVINMKNIRS